MQSQMVLCELNISRGICTSGPQKKPEDKNYLWDKNSTYTLIYAVFSHKKFPMVLSRLPRQHLLLRHAGERRGQGASTGVWGSGSYLDNYQQSPEPCFHCNASTPPQAFSNEMQQGCCCCTDCRICCILTICISVTPQSSSVLTQINSFNFPFLAMSAGAPIWLERQRWMIAHRFHPSSPPSYSLFNFSYA